MKKKRKNMFVILGVISTVLGVLGAVPSFLVQKYGVAAVASLLVIIGLVLLGIAFSD